jgi:hypothetical protein
VIAAPVARDAGGEVVFAEEGEGAIPPLTDVQVTEEVAGGQIPHAEVSPAVEDRETAAARGEEGGVQEVIEGPGLEEEVTAAE